MEQRRSGGITVQREEAPAWESRLAAALQGGVAGPPMTELPFLQLPAWAANKALDLADPVFTLRGAPVSSNAIDDTLEAAFAGSSGQRLYAQGDLGPVFEGATILASEYQVDAGLHLALETGHVRGEFLVETLRPARAHVVAAGIGRRYGGLKQLAPVGPNGEAIIDLTIADAAAAGFDEVVAIVPPDLVECTVEKVAVNAVLAGCRPEYVPVVLAAVEAACTDTFNMHGLLATTWFAGPLVVVNGPIARRIGMNSGINALGPGNRANATIGRALQLVVRNVGGGRHRWARCSTIARRPHPRPRLSRCGVCVVQGTEVADGTEVDRARRRALGPRLERRRDEQHLTRVRALECAARNGAHRSGLSGHRCQHRKRSMRSAVKRKQKSRLGHWVG